MLGGPAPSCGLLPSRPLPTPCLSCQRSQGPVQLRWELAALRRTQPLSLVSRNCDLSATGDKGFFWVVQTLQALRRSGQGMRGLGAPSFQSPCSREHTARGPSEPPRAGTRLLMTAADSQRLLYYLERKPTARAPFPTAGRHPSSGQEAAGTSVPGGGGPGWLLGGEHASTKAGAAGGPLSAHCCRPPLRGPALTCRVSQPPVSPHCHKPPPPSGNPGFLSAFPPSQEHAHLDPSGAGGCKRQCPVRLGVGQGLGLPQHEAALPFPHLSGVMLMEDPPGVTQSCPSVWTKPWSDKDLFVLRPQCPGRGLMPQLGPASWAR